MAVRKRYLAAIAGVVLPLAGLSAMQFGGVSPGHAAGFNMSKAPTIQQRLISQFSDNAAGFRAASARGASSTSGFSNLTPSQAGGPQCGLSLGSNVKVNQGCLNISAADLQGRGQAHNETTIAVNPSNPNELVAASNDYSLGDGLAGGTSYSKDGGKTWQDSTVPVEFTRGSAFPGDPYPRMYWQGGGDPSVAWDSHGNAYFTGLHFNRGLGTSDIADYSSGVFTYRSVGNGGASWSFPGTPVATSYQPTTPAFGTPLLDKPYMAIDTHASSPYRDRIYVTYTNFAADGTAYIYEAYSSDYARTFSAPVLVSKNSASLCPQNYSFIGVTPENSNNCDENQFSDPFTGSDGNLYVVYSNFNNAAAVSTSGDNHFQVLLAKSTNGGATFSAPVDATHYYDLPDCGTYQGGQDEGRNCVPEQGSQTNSIFRADNYPSGAVDPTNPNHIVVTIGSYINADSKAPACTPNGTDQDFFLPLYNGVKTGGCANKILVSQSNNAGSSFVNTDPRTEAVAPQSPNQAHTDQWNQWSAFNNAGKVVVSYFDRSYGSDITNGNMDVTLSDQAAPGTTMTFNQTRVTSASMPLPTQFPEASGNSDFFGDYAGLAVSTVAHPLWMDTRDPDLFDCGTNPPSICLAIESGNGQVANQQDLFTASLPT